MTLAAQCCPNMTVRQEAEEIIVTYSIGGVPYDTACTISQEPARFSNTWAAIPMEAEPLRWLAMCASTALVPPLSSCNQPLGGEMGVCAVCATARGTYANLKT